MIYLYIIIYIYILNKYIYIIQHIYIYIIADNVWKWITIRHFQIIRFRDFASARLGSPTEVEFELQLKVQAPSAADMLTCHVGLSVRWQKPFVFLASKTLGS